MEIKYSAAEKKELTARWHDRDEDTGIPRRAAMIEQLTSRCRQGIPDRPMSLDLRGIDLNNLNLSGLDFSGYDISFATMNRADLTGTNFSYARLIS